MKALGKTLLAILIIALVGGGVYLGVLGATFSKNQPTQSHMFAKTKVSKIRPLRLIRAKN